MTDIRALSLQAVVLKVLADKVKARRDGVNRELSAALDPGDRKTAALASGVKVGTVSYTNGRAAAAVVDERAFMAWVAANRPDEIVQTVRDSYRAYLLEEVRANGGLLDMATGEAVEIPGVAVRAGSPYLSVRADPAGMTALADAIRANEILALEAE